MGAPSMPSAASSMNLIISNEQCNYEQAAEYVIYNFWAIELSCMVCSPMGSTLLMVYYGARLSACRWIRYVIHCISFAMTLHTHFLVCNISHPQANCLIIPNSFEQRLQYKDEIFKHPWGDWQALKCRVHQFGPLFSVYFAFLDIQGLMWRTIQHEDWIQSSSIYEEIIKTLQNCIYKHSTDSENVQRY
jgi:hypothetical protein